MFVKAYGQLATLIHNFDADPGDKDRSTLKSAHGVQETIYVLIRQQKDIEELKERLEREPLGTEVTLVQCNGVDRELEEQLNALAKPAAEGEVEGSAVLKTGQTLGLPTKDRDKGKEKKVEEPAYGHTNQSQHKK